MHRVEYSRQTLVRRHKVSGAAQEVWLDSDHFDRQESENPRIYSRFAISRRWAFPSAERRVYCTPVAPPTGCSPDGRTESGLDQFANLICGQVLRVRLESLTYFPYPTAGITGVFAGITGGKQTRLPASTVPSSCKRPHPARPDW